MLKRLLALPLAAGLIALPPAAASAATTWTVQPVPTPSGMSSKALASVSCVSTTDCVAVGFADQTLAEQWNGSTWTVMPAPSPANSTMVLLNSVDCTAADNCIAVGYYHFDKHTGADQRTVAELWNGSTWKIEPTPGPFAHQDEYGLAAVSCASATDCTAVGNDQVGSKNYGLIETWNGTAWSVAATPLNMASLNSIACPASSGCYIAAFTSAVEFWNGSTLTSEPLAAPSGASSYEADGITCLTSDSCYAVGSQGVTDPDAGLSLVEYWNGTAWTAMLTHNPVKADGSGLAAVSCTSVSNCTTVGDSFKSGNTVVNLLAEHWNGSGGWGLQQPPNPGANNFFLGVSCAAPADCVAVGYDSARPVSEVWRS